MLLGGTQLAGGECVKYLGLYIDKKLSFNSHIDYLKGKLAHLAGASFRLKNFMTLRAAKCFYFSCVYSILRYCLPVYGGALSSFRGRKLDRIYGKIVRNLFEKHSPGQCPFKANKILKLGDAYKLLAGMHMFRMINGENEELADTMVLEPPNHVYNTRNRIRIQPPFPRVDAIRRNYQYQFIHFRNEIPDEIKNSRSLNCFKSMLTNKFLSEY